jgi:hypothetical protein
VSEKLHSIQTYNTRSKSRKFYQEVTRLNVGYQPQSRTCKEKEVNLVGGKQEVLHRCIQYFQELLNKPSNTMSDSCIQYYAPQKYVGKPIVSMVYNVIKRLKKNRVPCEGSRAAELQKYGGRNLWRRIYNLMIIIWENQEMPAD